MDNTNKFTGKSSAYASSRPKYAEQFIQYLKNSAGLGLESIVADIGSGTGILSSQLLDIGCTVIAVEPNDDMRNTAEKLLGGNERFNSVKGSAENTALEDYSVNYITVGQAFHWFDRKAFRAECRRILRESGKVVLVWNSRVEETALIMENDAINRRYCPRYQGFSGGMNPKTADFSDFFSGGYEVCSFDHPIWMDEQTFIGRNLSSSYACRPRDAGYEEYVSALRRLFERYSADGGLWMPNVTRSYVGRV